MTTPFNKYLLNDPIALVIRYSLYINPEAFVTAKICKQIYSHPNSITDAIIRSTEPETPQLAAPLNRKDKRCTPIGPEAGTIAPEMHIGGGISIVFPSHLQPDRPVLELFSDLGVR